MAVAAVSITIQVGATVVLSYVGVPVPVSAAIGAGLSNLAGQGDGVGTGHAGARRTGIDWGDVGDRRCGRLSSRSRSWRSVSRASSRRARPRSLAAGQERLRWLDERPGSELERYRAAHCSMSASTRWAPCSAGRRSVGPERDGLRAFNFGLGGLINSAYNPSSGWAIPGSGRSPTVGAFEYAYSAVANGLADHGLQLDSRAARAAERAD